MDDQSAQFTIGSEVECSDGACGELRQVVVDPIRRAATHLVVEPTHRSGLGRLVPLEMVGITGETVTLSCTVADFDRLPHAEETRFLPGPRGFDYGPEQLLAWPYFGLGHGGMYALGANVSEPVTYDKLPVGEIAVHRGESVHATDGDIGSVQGLVVDPSDHCVTHVLLEEGHLWGKKEVAIPISAVAGVESGIELTISKEQVGDLPPVDLDREPSGDG